ncbi:tripartite tricarboxylate transporter TctB family protein [Aminobacter aminovorans]|uniref:tripartite tricarboxylate transporter TctB family protein n=1 Tax=Aminobacter TaxID=31988 RepID=UPI0028655D53|nr:tripartite tricarboxylate transporter TctB family protein [Aminobacter aminovorans]MDR7223706.1 hypothetical protein [Aminobacter aminovorans]
MAAGAVFLILALIGAYSIYFDPYLDIGKAGNDPGPTFIPWIGIFTLGFGGIAQMVVTFIQSRKVGGFTFSGEFVLSKMWLPAALVASLVGLQMAMKPIGFLNASLIFALPWVFILHWRAGGKFTQRYLIQLLVEAGLVAGGIYYLFAYGINVPFP